MMSNKRGSEDIINAVEQSPQSEGSTPKRTKLDFLAMIAGLSEHTDVEANPAFALAAVATTPVAHAEKPKSDSSNPAVVSIEKPDSPKKEAPTSSFAAWKRAKGRKNGSKSPVPKDTPADAEVVVIEDTEATSKARLMMGNPLAALAAAAAAPFAVATSPTSVDEVNMVMPPQQAPKDASSKKSTSPKKVGSTSPKKALKKKADAGKSKGSSKSKSKKGDHSGAKTATFPEKIMEVLQGNLAPGAIYWLPEGEAIAVDPDSFKDNAIISKQFRGNKLSSFVRSLNRWGFRRIFYHSLPDKTLAFYHRLFQKRTPELVKDMKMDSGEKEPELPQGAMAIAPTATADGTLPAMMEAQAPPKKPESPTPSVPAATPALANPPLPAVVERVPPSPGLASAPALSALQAVLQAKSLPAPTPPVVPSEPVLSAAAIPSAVPSHSELQRSALEFAEGQHARALQLQQAMAAEQERSDFALQSLQAQQLVLQSLADQQNVAQAEELLMQSMIAEQQRSELALQQRQAEQILLQQMLQEQETAALAAALGGGAGVGAGALNAEAVLRERLLLQQLAANQSPSAAAAGGSDVLALLQQQLQGAQQAPAAREPSYIEQLLLLEQQQQQQRQQEAVLLAAHGLRFG